jgi:hypothetical protein
MHKFVQQVTIVLLGFVSTSPASHAQTSGAGDITLRPATTAVFVGDWVKTADQSAAGGAAAWYPNRDRAKILSALANPTSYFEIPFEAQAGIPYRLWMRVRAENNYWANDSVFVQFSGAVDDGNNPVFRIGTTSATFVNLEDCSGCGISGWGWQDNGWGTGVFGPAIYFATSGPQKLRVQSREDGARIDQILLSPSKFIGSAPGALKNDTTIFPAAGDPPPPSVTLVRGPYLQQVDASAATVVWATREAGPAEVQYGSASSPLSAAASTRLVTAAKTGLGFDYYQHEARLTALSSSTTYPYQTIVNGSAVSAGGGQIRTAPAPGTGSVRFVAFGDSGTGSADQQRIAQRLAAETFDIALHTGDIVYGNSNGTGEATYRTYGDWFFGIYRWLGSRAVFTAEGNHDSGPSNNNGTAYLDLFSLPRNGGTSAAPDHAERYYSFDYGPVHFIALDTEFTFQDLNRRAHQIAWIEADLAATNQPWKVAFFHRPPWNAGDGHGSDTAVRAAFSPLFERYGVQLAVSSHEHGYERTVPIRESTTGTAVTYIVTGGGGAPVYPTNTATWTVKSASVHHYVRVEADTCTLKLDAVDGNGVAFDTTTLSRCSPPTPPPPAAPEVVLYAGNAPVRAGQWTVVPDTTAAAGQRIRHADAGAAKVTTATASPANYFELTFDAEAGTPYRLWIRGKADSNHWANDSVFAQFSGSVNAFGTPVYRIGTTSGAEVNLEECSGCGVSGWGWQDNGYGKGALGPAVYFATAGRQTIRVQTREDGFSIDQIVLSPGRFLTSSPGLPKNDTTIIQP